ncbi:hypothetical protein AA958_23780 [Streptomyces sp. CNQ-509]|uniref:hypothetical protein n=1 Tax=unclassified Streptomyces TaxID=2593676 RepID=UPI00062DE753|nr:hypothetical protein [Streptomyces sp. CNQ-509]AKH86995.1 hypothetical protein AA958_23780 [Streptomyces sp. CNQ-509]
MSIPPGPPPNPYQQNNPNPYAQQQPQGSVPQQYSYAQPTMPAGVPIAGQPAGGPPGQPPGQPPGAPPPAFGAAEKKGVPAWLWGLGGVVVASAVWAGVLFATGGFDSSEDPEPVLGYGFEKDLCESTELKAFEERYEIPDASDATGWGSEQDALSQSFCSWSLTDREQDPDDYSSSYVSVTAIWHGASDPTGEFAPTYKGYEDRSDADYKYETEPVKGFGEEAYLVRENGEGDSSSRSMSLAVRDGWFTYQMDWSFYGGTDSTDPPSPDEVEQMLKDETKTALADLKK